MSLGWDDGKDEVESAIHKALAASVLVFAAASNKGLTRPLNLAFPARKFPVISLFSANGEGTSSGSNPPAKEPRGNAFATLGEHVSSTWPLGLSDGGHKRQSGTSTAIPIAAGIAALVLEFARQPSLSTHPEVGRWLKTNKGMREVFGLMSERKENNFDYVFPWKLLNVELGNGTKEDHVDDLNDQFSARNTAASKINELFRNFYKIKP